MMAAHATAKVVRCLHDWADLLRHGDAKVAWRGMEQEDTMFKIITASLLVGLRHPLGETGKPVKIMIIIIVCFIPLHQTD